MENERVFIELAWETTLVPKFSVPVPVVTDLPLPESGKRYEEPSARRMRTPPLSDPPPWGMKLTLIVQLVPAAMAPPDIGQVPERLPNSPVTVIPVTFIGVVKGLVKVAV